MRLLMLYGIYMINGKQNKNKKECTFEKEIPNYIFFSKIRATDAKWEYGTVLLEAPPDITEFRVVMVAERHDSKNGFVAVDEFEFIENDKCVLNPPQVKNIFTGQCFAF